MYTASFAFFEALWDAGVRYVFVNLGSDHPSIIEAIAKGRAEKKDNFPQIITCPNEMVALSMADGFARLTRKPQAVLVHVDVGTQGLGAAVHNASCGRAPVLIFAGMSPFTIEGEMRGSRSEFSMWIQDVPDQKQIVSQYCRYAAEIKTGKNIKQMVNRALQFASSDPAGPVYLTGAREVMEEDLNPYELVQEHWGSVEPAALSETAVSTITEALAAAKEPLVIVGYTGRNHATVPALVQLTETIKGLRVLDTGGCDMCFPADHHAYLGLSFGVHDSIKTADLILVIECDVPWINIRCHPAPTAKVFHIDVDPLKTQMPVFYLAAVARYRADSYTAITQLNAHFSKTPPNISQDVSKQRWDALHTAHTTRLDAIQCLTVPQPDGSFGTSYLCSRLRQIVPDDTIWVIEAVTNTVFAADAIRPTLPGTWINCGGGGLGWSGGAALGIKLASEWQHGRGKGKFVCQIVGDGSFLFSVPGSVYWICQKYDIPILTIVLNNEGWQAPRRSLLLVHPEGAGSKLTNKDIDISFGPVSPDYSALAKAAAGGRLHAEKVDRAADLDAALGRAVDMVLAGTSAVVDTLVVPGC